MPIYRLPSPTTISSRPKNKLDDGDVETRNLMQKEQLLLYKPSSIHVLQHNQVFMTLSNGTTKDTLVVYLLSLPHHKTGNSSFIAKISHEIYRRL